MVPENAKGWSYRRLFADYLQGCSGIIIREPYIRAFHQVRNLVEFLSMVNEITPVGDEVPLHLINGSDQETMEKQGRESRPGARFLRRHQHPLHLGDRCQPQFPRP